MCRTAKVFGIASILLILVTGCGHGQPPLSLIPEVASPTLLPAPATPVPSPTLKPDEALRAEGLSAEQVATLGSLVQVDDYPLYMMRFHGEYRQPGSRAGTGDAWVVVAQMASGPAQSVPAWSCSLFAALADEGGRLYGRNFDWRFSPALLLFTDPPDGYASVSIVDIAYLGFDGERAHGIEDLPLEERRGLLEAPLWPFDGMNEHGLVVGMAAVPSGQGRPEPAKETVDSLGIIRLMLDGARDVDEAVALTQGYNVDMDGGPDLHYLLADRSGQSALVEFYGGERVVIRNEEPWHLATNFVRASVGQSAAGQCERYDRIEQSLAETGGRLGADQAMALLGGVANQTTQWSAVYGMSTGTIRVAMGRHYDSSHSFDLPLVQAQGSP